MTIIRKKLILLSFILVISNLIVFAQQTPLVSFVPGASKFALVNELNAANIFTDPEADLGVKKAARDLSEDVNRVTDIQPKLTEQLNGKQLVIIGTIGKSKTIDQLIAAKKLNVEQIRGGWENCITQVINQPFPGVDRALVIAGSDKRGTIYGIYTLSEKIGVSPWYYWADVPTTKRNTIFVNNGTFVQGSPKVKYRGIFLNDEAPALSGWSKEKFGGFNSKFYDKVFELILRLKGNYLWPAMWGNAFYDDDPKNAILADEYGVVVGTSHHEPLTRAHDEWRRYGKGAWNYNTNKEALQKFWTDGITRMGQKESIVSIGMRGDGDEPMSEESNISLLENIVKDQREIIANVTGKAAHKTPQLWALYKEVQDYYDRGMRVPDDVTLLLCDDNWGNIRKLPSLSAQPRKGGYGIYYHFDYVGGPRNYKWINTNPITKVWEQMNLAYTHNANEIWIVNVGDLKPMEFPISFFLDYAWNPEKWQANTLQNYTNQWAARQFSSAYAKEIGNIISAYSKLAGRRKPELLDQNTYSVVQYREFETVVNTYKKLLKDALTIRAKLAPRYHDAYYQLVLHPVEAAANLNELYFSVAKNHLYAKQNRVSANFEAEKAKRLYTKDSTITHYYNKILANGKWNHMMDQTHIGYTYWQQPEKNKIPELKQVQPYSKPTMAIAIEGKEENWPNSSNNALLPTFNSFTKKRYYIDIFNQGVGKFSYSINAKHPWIKISEMKGQVSTEKRIWIELDWAKVPAGTHASSVIVNSPGQNKIEIAINAIKKTVKASGFVADNDVISIEAHHFSSKKNNASATWEILPDYGRTLAAIRSSPSTAKAQIPGDKNSALVSYEIYIDKPGTYKVSAFFAPTLDFLNNGGLRYGISFDDEKPQIINLNSDKSESTWNKHVAENINIKQSTHQLNKTGAHVIKIWMVDPGVVLQKLVLAPETYKEQSYLGPPESKFIK
ncbi:MAG: glycosyl hydrolase [Pedobacter sp.]|nr:MAG: glycosyl hydrolase [Pedobacter sp.]